MLCFALLFLGGFLDPSGLLSFFSCFVSSGIFGCVFFSELLAHTRLLSRVFWRERECVCVILLFWGDFGYSIDRELDRGFFIILIASFFFFLLDVVVIAIWFVEIWLGKWGGVGLQ